MFNFKPHISAFTRFAQNKDDGGFFFAYEAFHLGTLGKPVQSLDCDVKLCLRRPHLDPFYSALPVNYKEKPGGSDLNSELYSEAWATDPDGNLYPEPLSIYLDPACNPGKGLKTLRFNILFALNLFISSEFFNKIFRYYYFHRRHDTIISDAVSN